MSESNTLEQPDSLEETSCTNNVESNGFDGDVEDGGVINDDMNQVTSSSPEEPNHEIEESTEFLPFQSLAVEFKEGDDTPEENGIDSSVTTDLSQDLSDVAVVTTDLSQDLSDVAVVTNDGSLIGDDPTGETTRSDGDTGDANPEITLGGLPPEVDDDAAVDYDTSLYLQQQMEMDESNPERGIQEEAKSYLEDFLLSAPSTSTVGTYDSDSLSNDEKCLPLSRFPKIVKNMEQTDYSTLQVLYSLLYLKNAWDTEELLTQKILDFSGFNCELNSEDYYTREVMLRTVACDVLLNIAKLLCVESPTVTTDFDKCKLDIVSKIMAFLHKPKRRRAPRQKTRQGGPKKTGPSRGRGRPALHTKNTVPRSKIELGTITKASNPDVVSSSDNSCSNSTVGDGKLNVLDSVKAGLKSSKSKSYLSLLPPVIPVSPEKVLELENTLKKDIADGKAIQPKVVLQRLDSHDLTILSGSSPAKDKATEKVDSMESSDNAQNADKPKMLKDFPSVLSSIEGTPDDLLSDVFMVLYLRRGRLGEIKEKILEFKGFFAEQDSEEYKKRVDCLNKMDENVVKDIARALFLDPKSEKDATITHILSFLTEPKEEHLRPTVIAPGMLEDCDIDFEAMSDDDDDDDSSDDSDDSITCEVVHKKVECIDLLSSGEDEPDSNPSKVVVKKEPQEKLLAPKPVATPRTILVSSLSKGKRSLKDFETITKIVNTHPTEYLVDIYNLLYMKPHELSTLRKEILDFGGFQFERSSQEYIRRKQFLDRMLYNSVRRIYNTVIHNTREVKVFSKPTMIGEIFGFLFKLPDTDTSIRPSVVKLPGIPANVNATKSSDVATTTANAQAAPAKVSIPAIQSQPGKLSDLKRVFQRVACFPCEYLVDVHKLLFMSDCDMKDIRTNIFSFKGFSFDVDSQEFNQRKLYLEYLTFHSLRKISSVLTTKTVDLRNSTKHELSSHLTEVLKEYCNTVFELEKILAADPPAVAAAITNAAGPSTATAAGKNVVMARPAEQEIEQIVVTPIIHSLQSAVNSLPEVPAKPAVMHKGNATTNSKTVTNVRPYVRQDPKMVAKHNIPPPPPDTNPQLQFPDIRLPELERYQNMYPAMSKTVILNQPSDHMTIAQPYFRPEFIMQPMGTQYAPLIPSGVPFLSAYPPTMRLPMPPASYSLNIGPAPQPASAAPNPPPAPDEGGSKTSKHDKEDLSSSAAKRLKGNDGEAHNVETKDSEDGSSTLKIKIMDALTKASEDEEDCDKPLATLLGHPNDSMLTKQISDVVENTDLQEITINGVIQKIFGMYPQFNLNYRKEFIKTTLRTVLYKLSEVNSGKAKLDDIVSNSPDCAVSTTDERDNPEQFDESPEKS